MCVYSRAMAFGGIFAGAISLFSTRELLGFYMCAEASMCVFDGE